MPTDAQQESEMTEQVKRFRADLCVQPIEVVAATHYDALHQQVEGLQRQVTDLTNQRDAILLQARCWAGEAKAQQAITKAVGEALGGVPNWGPIAAGVEALRKRARTAEREAAKALRTLKGLEKVARVVDANSDQVCGENNRLRAELEAARAENEGKQQAIAWRDARIAEMEVESVEDTKSINELLASIYNFNQMAAEFEAARGLLSMARDYVSNELDTRKQAMAGYPHKWRQEEEDLAAIDAFLTATPAPEVRQQEQGERQAVGHVAHGSHTGVVFYSHVPQLPDGAKLYAEPQPAPGVSALVEALEAIESAALSIGVERRAIHLAAKNALATYRKRN